jgi:steroid 5-alpha reductase family enzyme
MPLHLEKLCADAQLSELDGENTSSSTFYFLSAIQPAVALCFCWLIAAPGQWDRWIMMLLGCYGGHLIGWIVSELSGSCKWFDVTEDITYAFVFYNVYMSMYQPSQWARFVWALAALWLARLLGFLGWRIVVRGSDFRFDKLVTNRSYNLFGWTSGGTWCVLNGTCLWLLADHASAVSSRDTPNIALMLIGIFVFVLGITVETTADVQKSIFNSLCHSGSQKTWIQSGLWAYSRHPNYLGEITVWFGLSLTCMSMGCSPLCLISPIWSALFLFFTSLMLLEKRADLKFRDKKGYSAYKKKTPILLPFHL